MEKNFGIFSRELRENQFFHAGNDFELKNDIIKAHNISQNSFNYKYSQIQLKRSIYIIKLLKFNLVNELYYCIKSLKFIQVDLQKRYIESKNTCVKALTC